MLHPSQTQYLSYYDKDLAISNLSLASGESIREINLCYRVHGEVGRPLVFVLGGISAHRGLNDSADSKKPWWRELVGPGKAIDTEFFCVVGFDYLGGDGRSSGPLSAHWPGSIKIDTQDQAACLDLISRDLGYSEIYGLVGASYGAMVGLAFANRNLKRLRKLVCISGAHRSHPMAMAWRYIQREILDIAEKLNQSMDSISSSQKLVSLSRALAMTSYRSPEEFSLRFRSVDEVASYLNARGDDYAKKRNPKSYYCLSESIDRHSVVLKPSNVDVHIIGFEQDRLVPVEVLRELAVLCAAELHLFHSIYGHDAFLKEFGILNRLLPKVLEA